MPRNSTVLQVFVASPSDVVDERATLDSVIEELNRTWATNLGISFEVLKWEINARPSFNTDPQAVINAQIPNDYDVFIGIFWSRIGTPTGRATSGTIEEFERAYQRFKATGSTPEIMLYFKDAPLNPSKIEADQLGAVQSFRNSLSDKGGLYSMFEDQSGFEASVRVHLSAIAQKFSSYSNSHQQPVPTIPSDTIPIVEDEDYGLLDYLDVYNTRTQDMTATMEVINEATVRIGEQLSQRSAEITSRDLVDAATARKLVKRASEDMSRYAESLDSNLSVLSSARKEALAALSSAVALMADFNSDQEQLETLHDALHGTIGGAATAKSGLQGMREAANRLPRVSKELNKSKREVIQNLDKLLSEIESTESTVKNIADAIERLLSSSEKTRSHEAMWPNPQRLPR